jgi:hypothetical protein
MKIKKITTGFVIQVFDTDTQKYESQEFIAGDQVDYEDGNGDCVDPVKLGMGNENGEEPYLPFAMVQP